MIILKYELKRHRKYILGWAIALALCVFVMTPTYYSFMDVSTGDLYETLGTSDFYKGVGVSMEYLTSPLGIYAFLPSQYRSETGPAPKKRREDIPCSRPLRRKKP